MKRLAIRWLGGKTRIIVITLGVLFFSETVSAVAVTLGPAQYRIDVFVEGCNSGGLDCSGGESAYFDLTWSGGTLITLDLNPSAPDSGSASWHLSNATIQLTTQSNQTYSFNQANGSTWSLFLVNNATQNHPDEFWLGGGSSISGNRFKFQVEGDYGFVPGFEAAENLSLLDTSEIMYDNSFAVFDFYQIDFLVTNVSIPTVPLPAPAFLFGSGLIGLLGIAKRKAA